MCIPDAPGLGRDVSGLLVGGQETGSWGQPERGREWGGSLSTERVKFLARAQGARIKEPLFSVLGCRQLPPPAAASAAHLSWHHSWYVALGQGLPQPPSPQTTGSFSSASSDLGAPDPVSVPSRVSCRDMHTALFFLSPSP